ncbi:hypothetical protein [Pseudomonas protegens]|uniref:hypothetical protein n=1 Tax=Pseudomonas protegens TaxID=380021 RepID=UPI000AFFB322|nr:hypothetical protein [Pseudomonas protegens]
MDDSTVDKFLSTFPGAKRAAQGVIIPAGDGNILQIYNLLSSKETKGLSNSESFFLAFCSKSEILRLRELRGSHDYLLRFRANAIVDAPRAVRVMRSRRKKFESTGRPWALTHYYHSRDSHHKSYLNLLKRADAKQLRNIPTGLAFIPDVNALCIRSLAGDIVVVSESLEHFYYFMTLAFYGDSLGIDPIDQGDALLIAIRIMNGSEALDFEIDPRGNLGQELERKLAGLVKAQMQFTFGHEYAHLLCGHLSSDDAPIKSGLMENRSEILQDLKTYNHSLEYEADFCALNNLKHNQAACLEVTEGAFSVLLYLHFIDEVRELYGLKKLTISATHPTPLNRIINLHKSLGRYSPLTDDMLKRLLEKTQYLSKLLTQRIHSSGKDDALTFYGSIYLSSYTSRVKKDRYDF